jgi:hypothetical protein
MFTEIKECRIGGGGNLISVLELGTQALTGVFPRSPLQDLAVGPLELVWCPESGLVQLKHSFAADQMYGDTYGYRSGLNQSMVRHLTNKVRYLERLTDAKAGDVILDIGSNDCTTLKAYSIDGLRLIGVDPTGKKFSDFYPDNVTLVPKFFSSDAYHSVTKQKAKIISSIAMFYDLEDPVSFACQIENILADDGVWHFEQSYLPSMLRMTSYDTICHEHIEYYSLGVVIRILKSANLKVIDVNTNSVNGGSFAVTAVKENNSTYASNDTVINWMIEQEEIMGLSTSDIYLKFARRVSQHRSSLTTLINRLADDGKTIYGCGASTKGNVLLQYCNFSSDQIRGIAEVNEDKFGCVTPGTHIPIMSEEEVRAAEPDYLLVLPWHFKDGILQREKDYLDRGGKLIFPFPEIEIIN